MTAPETDYTEMSLVERSTIEKFEKLGWETCDAGDEQPGPGSMLGQDRPGQVVLTERLRPRLEAFNPDVPTEAIDHALEKITKSRKAMGPVVANREVYEMLTGEDGEGNNLYDRSRGEVPA